MIALLLAGLFLVAPGYGAADPCWRGFLVAVIHVVDGDTIDIEVTWEPKHTATERIRLVGVDTPERKGDTIAAADAATAFTTKWLEQSGATEFIVCGGPIRDPRGRMLGRLVSATKGDLSAALLASGHAKPYP